MLRLCVYVKIIKTGSRAPDSKTAKADEFKRFAPTHPHTQLKNINNMIISWLIMQLMFSEQLYTYCRVDGHRAYSINHKTYTFCTWFLRSKYTATTTTHNYKCVTRKGSSYAWFALHCLPPFDVKMYRVLAYVKR